MSVDGDTAVVTLHRSRASAAAGTARYGARIDRFWRGYDRAEIAAHNVGTQSVCGTDARRDVVCYQNSHPTEFARGSAVARLLHRRRRDVHHLAGRQHQPHADQQALLLDAPRRPRPARCSSTTSAPPAAATTRAPAPRSAAPRCCAPAAPLDYTLFSVNNFAAIQRFGTLFLDGARTANGERIYIPGHGDGAQATVHLREHPERRRRARCATRNCNASTSLQL